jgi:Domain of unknown function (DUF4156)
MKGARSPGVGYTIDAWFVTRFFCVEDGVMINGTGFALALLLLSVLSSCTWVSLTDEGARVQLRTLEQARACERKSRVTVSVKDKIGGIARNEDKVRGELETLARNEAARVGGNAVAAESEPTDGRQVFLIYHCP